MRVRSAVSRSILHYYVALKLSAGAIAPMFGPQFLDSPPPIVRRLMHPGETTWDSREVVTVRDQQAVVTLPLEIQGTHRTSFVGKN